MEKHSDGSRSDSSLPTFSEMLAHLASVFPGCLASFRQRPDGSFHVPYCSDRALELCGLPRETLAEDAGPFLTRIHPDDRPRVRAALDQSHHTMGPWHAEFRYLHPNGRELWVEGHSAPERQSDDSTVWHGVLTDVTERKQTEEHLRLSQARLGEALRAGRLGTWMIDVTTQQIWFDLRSRSMLALSPYDTTWLSLSEITGMLHVDDRTRVLRALDRYLQGLPDRVAEQFRMVRTDGRTVFLSVSGAAERDAAGLVVKLAGTLADMTEQRHAQQRLRDSEDRFARLFELSPASQLLVRVPDHRIIEANDAAARLLGCAREDLIGLAAPADVIDLALEGQDVLWSCLGANRPDRGVVIEGFRRDGTSFYAEASRDIFRMDDEDHALVVMMDLTARRTA